MLSWVLRHRLQLRALYGLPPEPALADLIEEQRRHEELEGLPQVLPRDGKRGLPQVMLPPARRRGA
ncbi:MAG: hypothetical protein ACYSWX_09790 [Planctomycetota bacterium]|jgi:hypothetical protein